jgi:hydrogenase large subunit
MSNKLTLNVPINRVEGDLEVRVELEDGVVTDAWCSGTMYRGFEKILEGRGALDGLVITPRICGICGTAHLTAAARALDQIGDVSPPPGAVRIRNVALMTEKIQSDVRHGFLMFTADFVNQVHEDNPLYPEACRRYTPYEGQSVVEAIRETKKVLEIVAIIGGQWPHSSYMVPGGIASVPSRGDLLQCRLLLSNYRAWYERRVLGCSIERWLEVRSRDQLDAWLDEAEEHARGELGFVIRFARAAGLDGVGRGHGNFISFGAAELPAGTALAAAGGRLIPAGFARGVEVSPFEQTGVAEHVAHSWFVDYPGGKHPFEGETRPYASGHEGEKYSWAKAPRYEGAPAETGPLAEAVIAGDPLLCDLVTREGPSVLTRELARLVRPCKLIPAMETWLQESDGEDRYYISPGEITDGDGIGLTEATRGALGHWVRVADGSILHYQIVTPTAWNASPRDTAGVRGPMEEALVGTPVRDSDNPVELGHVVRSFDACLVCTVHLVGRGRVRGAPLVVAP